MIAILAAVVSCSGYSITGGPKPLVKSPLTTAAHPSFRPERLNLIAIHPVQASILPQSALDGLTSMLVSAFQVRSNLGIANLKDPALFAKVSEELSDKDIPLAARVLKYGEKLGAQGVLTAQVSEFRDSSGSRLGADSGASVGFKLRLFDTRSGEEVWTAIYEAGNEPLSENLFQVPNRLSHGIQYKTADKLVSEGFLKAAGELESLRVQAIY